MPLVLSHKNAFRGIFSQREILCETIRDLMGFSDESYEEALLIKSPHGHVSFTREDGSVERFCKFNYPNLCRELKLQSRVAIFDDQGEEYLFAVWLSQINEVFYSKSDEDQRKKMEIEERSKPSIVPSKEVVSA